MPLTSKIRSLVAVAALALGTMAAGGQSPAVAAEPDGFYATPTSLPAMNGDIVRSEPSSFYLDPLHALKAPAEAHRIMYRTTNRLGTPIAVTGTVLTPLTAWRGSGPRPIIGFAVGTQGMADKCAPSKLMSSGIEYEGPFIAGLLARGYGVAITDYPGLGMDGTHPYVQREALGRAVLDSIRAAQRLDAADLPDDGPVAVVGYSEGGNASASAGELAPTYAPELKVKGVSAGAPPADPQLVAGFTDETLLGAVVGYAMIAVSADRGLPLDDLLHESGEKILAQLEQECVVESAAKHPFLRTRDLTEDGRPIKDILREEPWQSIMTDLVIGNGRSPQAPVLVTHSLLDDVVPYQAGRELASRWCDEGARVQLITNATPGHIASAVPSYLQTFTFLEARFAGQPAPSSCWRL